VSDEACGPRHESGGTGSALLAAALTGENLKRAFKRVRANKGAAGVDGLDIDQTARHLVTAWPVIREQLLKGTYRPGPVRRVTIPKPDGGERELGIPTVTDRLIQQALLQVLQPVLDSTFSEHSYGFRPGRRAHDAVLAAQSYVQSGRRIVVDVDLEKFFDRVNHDILIDRLQKRIDDAGVIRLIRAYLNSGIMDVQRGKYVGYLVTSQHRYMDGHASWDPYVLVSPEGKEIKVLGEFGDDEPSAEMAALQSVEGKSAAPTSAADAANSGYLEKVQRRVRPNIVWSGETQGQETVLAVRCTPTGTLLSATITRSSGNAAWDDAALRAVQRSDPMPQDINGKTPESFKITLRPAG
jgi:TonB family protein